MRRLRQIFPAPLLALITGLIVAAIGVILLIGGVWLTALGGSAYYLITGGAMLAAGLLLMRGRISGGWIYVAVVFCTLVWALWEVGGNGWALVPRVVAPIVLLILVIFAMAALSARPRRWRLALASSGLVVLLAVASGAMLGWLNSARPVQQLPASRWAKIGR